MSKMNLRFKGSKEEAASFSQCMLDYLNQTVAKNASLPAETGGDAVMGEAEVEIEESSDEDEEVRKLTKVKRRIKVKQSEADARTAKRPAKANKASGSKGTQKQ